MTIKLFKNTNAIVEYYIALFMGKDIVAVDMTVGNGNDIYKIAEIVGMDSSLYGFDISPIAIKNCMEKLRVFKGNNIKIIEDSHKYIHKYIKEDIDLAIYNLGYLPKGDKSITTDYKTVLESLEILLAKLTVNGVIVITFYPGHKSGLEESIEIEKRLRNISQKKFNILKFDFINQVNNPPYTIVIERLI